jgi:hypothetical protein
MRPACEQLADGGPPDAGPQQRARPLRKYAPPRCFLCLFPFAEARDTKMRSSPVSRHGTRIECGGTVTRRRAFPRHPAQAGCIRRVVVRYCQMIALQEDLAATEAHTQELRSLQGTEAALPVASGGRKRRGQILRSFVPARFCGGCTRAHATTHMRQPIDALLLLNGPSRPSPPLECGSHT